MDDRWWRLVGPLAIGVAAVAGVVVGVARVPDATPPAVIGELVDVTVAKAEIVVHVAGAVVVPGLVRVPAGSRVAEAIEAAGGVSGEAVLDGVNLAAPLVDGSQIVVPDRSGSVPVAGDGLVRLNQATAAELDELPGVGPVLAERIIAHRESDGPFSTVEDLLDVPGIGESKLESLRDLVAP